MDEHSASLRVGLRQQGRIFFSAYPALALTRGARYGTVPGYYQAVPGGTGSWKMFAEAPYLLSFVRPSSWLRLNLENVA